MILRSQGFVRGHPLKAGLMWTAMFIPLFVLVQFAFGRPVEGTRGFVGLIVFSLIGGVIWAYLTRAILNFFEDRRR